MTMMEIPVWFYATTLFASFGAGYALGHNFSQKSVVIDDKAVCDIPIQNKKRASEYIEKIYTNGRCTDVSCRFLGEAKRCTLIGKRCIYLT